MVAIPGGRLSVGEAGNDVGGGDGEESYGFVIESFALSKYEVTFEEYEKFVAAAAAPRRVLSDEGWGRGRRPVINVSWDDAAAYAEWLSERTGKLYRLPSELEWEYAARAETTTEYNWGGDVGRNRANCSDCGDSWEDKTAPVGQFAANPRGLHDMAGNVWEWVDGCSRAEEGDARVRRAGRETATNCGFRIALGGSVEGQGR